MLCVVHIEIINFDAAITSLFIEEGDTEEDCLKQAITKFTGLPVDVIENWDQLLNGDCVYLLERRIRISKCKPIAPEHESAIRQIFL